jgi:predicted transcriptional regulator
MASIRAKINSRLEKFLEVDYSGFRRAILCIFIKVIKATIDELHEMLSSKYNVSRNTVASMVGYIHSKLGILRAHKESYKTPMVYLLREEYRDLILKSVTSSKPSTESAA